MKRRSSVSCRAAMSAPSAGNQQPWSFVVVCDADLRSRICRGPPVCGHGRRMRPVVDPGVRRPRRVQVAGVLGAGLRCGYREHPRRGSRRSASERCGSASIPRWIARTGSGRCSGSRTRSSPSPWSPSAIRPRGSRRRADSAPTGSIATGGERRGRRTPDPHRRGPSPSHGASGRLHAHTAGRPGCATDRPAYGGRGLRDHPGDRGE